MFKLTTVSPDSKPSSPSPVAIQKQKTEFLIQADDQASFELWKSKLENVTKPPEDNTVSLVRLFNLHIQRKNGSFNIFRSFISTGA